MRSRKRSTLPFILFALVIAVIIVVISVTVTPISNLVFPNPGGKPGGVDVPPQRTAIPTPHGPTAIATTTAIGFPHAQGTLLVDGSGRPLRLHGAQIETSLNEMGAWHGGRGQSPEEKANTTIFQAMRAWNMNVLRLPISNWVYAKNPAKYLSDLDQVVEQANRAGLYVVLDLHDDSRAGGPYNLKLATAEMIPFWETIATHYRNNTMVMFDLLNEPYDYPGWSTWQHGGSVAGLPVLSVGMQDLANAVRSTGARQLIIVESWVKPVPSGGSWHTIGDHLIQDSNVMYSYHDYTIASPRADPSTWDAMWGPLLGRYPLYVGEWAFLPNAYHTFMCQGITLPQATQGVTTFLNYLEQRGINWTAWQFDTGHLILNYTSFTPTSLNGQWCCGQGPVCTTGMGTLVKSFLLGQ
jgi:endoglucanase